MAVGSRRIVPPGLATKPLTVDCTHKTIKQKSGNGEWEWSNGKRYW